ncbi:hypothetical protein ARMGADRAFT_1035697 [Armillaria gallica]|uniref:Uncharacterized protein n=1 Tax=Armillaria gallica TaxID=47427 RepID=A0A2H3DDB6_ARMGA|nr:hypothetical protein ARMGADRAFT_1035697 [Armillaria gallica]
MPELLISFNRGPRCWLYTVALGCFLIYDVISNELDAIAGIWAINILVAMVPSEDGCAAGKGNMASEGQDGKMESLLKKFWRVLLMMNLWRFESSQNIDGSIGICGLRMTVVWM